MTSYSLFFRSEVSGVLGEASVTSSHVPATDLLRFLKDVLCTLRVSVFQKSFSVCSRLSRAPKDVRHPVFPIVPPARHPLPRFPQTVKIPGFLSFPLLCPKRSGQGEKPRERDKAGGPLLPSAGRLTGLAPNLHSSHPTLTVLLPPHWAAAPGTRAAAGCVLSFRTELLVAMSRDSPEVTVPRGAGGGG